MNQNANILQAIAELGMKLAAATNSRDIAAYREAIKALSNSIQS